MIVQWGSRDILVLQLPRFPRFGGWNGTPSRLVTDSHPKAIQTLQDMVTRYGRVNCWGLTLIFFPGLAWVGAANGSDAYFSRKLPSGDESHFVLLCWPQSGSRPSTAWFQDTKAQIPCLRVGRYYGTIHVTVPRLWCHSEIKGSRSSKLQLKPYLCLPLPLP